MPPKRKSWLPFSKKTDPADSTTANEAAPPPSSFKAPEPTTAERLRPIQFSPNRLQTLYVTPSERNLYLAAMSQLDENPPHLALWSDPAPSLPHIDSTDAIPTPVQEGGGWPERIQSPVPTDPRLVTSPEARTNGGLQVREEFRRHAPAKEVKHANMALTGAGGVRFTRFPANVLVDLDKLFPANKVVTESVESLGAMGNGVVAFWKIKMFGSMWKRTGAEELDPIRLLISLIECLGTHGWTAVNSIRAGGRKADVQNLLFTHSLEIASNPPAYFAISFPVPDRISLISAPPKATPALLSAIRNAITSTSAGHQRSGTQDTDGSDKKGISWNDKKAKIKVEGWVYDGVYRFWLDGLRRKLVGGVKKDAVEFLQPHVVLNIISALSSLHYTLVASIPLQPISAGRDILIFASQPDTGVTAKDAYVPKARQSSPGTDGTESPVLVQRTASFPVPVEKDDPRTVNPEQRRLPWTCIVHAQGQGQGPGHNRSTSVEDRQSTLNESSRAPSAPHQSQAKQHRRNVSLDSTPVIKPQSSSVQSSPRPRNLLLKKTSLRRQTSNSSTVNAKNQSLPPRSRRTSDAGITNTRREEPGRRTGAVVAGTSDGVGDSWLVVDPPTRVGHLGMTMHTDPATGREVTPEREGGTAPLDVQPRIPAPQVTSLAPGPVQDGHERGYESGGSIYETPSANPSPPRLPPRPPQLQEQLLQQRQEQTMEQQQQQQQIREHQVPHPRPQQDYQQQHDLIPANLPLGNPITDDVSAVSSIPTHLPLKTPRSPNRVNQAEGVDIGIPSVHGSLDYIPSMMSFAPSQISHNPMSNDNHEHTNANNDVRMGRDFDPAVVNGQERYDDALSHMPGGLVAAPEDRKGKGKEGARKVWDEERGVWVEEVAPHSIGPDGPGSARTKISMS